MKKTPIYQEDVIEWAGKVVGGIIACYILIFAAIGIIVTVLYILT